MLFGPKGLFYIKLFVLLQEFSGYFPVVAYLGWSQLKFPGKADTEIP